MKTIGTATTELADGLHAAFAAAATRAPLLAPLFSLILARLDAVFRQLEALLAGWQLGTLPRPIERAPSAAISGSTPPAISRHKRAQTFMPRVRRRVVSAGEAATPAPSIAIPRATPMPGATPRRPHAMRQPVTLRIIFSKNRPFHPDAQPCHNRYDIKSFSHPSHPRQNARQSPPPSPKRRWLPPATLKGGLREPPASQPVPAGRPPQCGGARPGWH